MMKLHWKLNPYSSLQYNSANIIKLTYGLYDFAANNAVNVL